jgi:ubiquinone/menaquinone biosynthesis C-methylase UbiE
MNNPVRALIQRRFEARRLLEMGGPVPGGRALEIGCGVGNGVQVIFDLFGAASVDAFDLDPRMLSRARRRLAARGSRVSLWIGDASAIAAPDASYDAVFDFGIIHHVPGWRAALSEIHRVLRPGGRLYAEEVLRPFIDDPLARRLFKHPTHDRFDHDDFIDGLRAVRLTPLASRTQWRGFAWFIAAKPAAAAR